MEDEQKSEKGSALPKRMNAPSRLFRWLDQRTGVHAIMKESLDEPIPGGARLAYVFGSGLLFIFISQIITGLCLALYYVPSAETAHTSVAYITKQVAAGAFLRSLHYYGSSAMIIVLALHFLQTFLYGSFKGRRELLWISGAVLSFLVLGMGFTGYLLPWDQKAYFATAVGTNIVAEVPWIGNWLARLLRGGDTLGTLTLSRFYVAHVFLIPAGIFLFIGAHLMLFRKAGPAGPIEEDPVAPKLAPEGFYPRQVLTDMAFALLIMVGVGVLAYFHPAGLGPVANPADTQFLPRPEWYYLSMFEWLKFWEGPKVVLAVIVIPGILALLFFLLPFLDRSLERRPWRRPIPVLSVAIVLAGMLYLGVKSHTDDQRDPTTAAQLTTQEEQEKAYGAAPFEPYLESPGGTLPATVTAGPANPLVATGRGLFEAHGCAACHGAAGVGTPIAPALIGITTKLPGDQLSTLLFHPNGKMIAGHMPAVDMSAPEMASLTAYLGVLGTAKANAPAAHGEVTLVAASAPVASGAAKVTAGSLLPVSSSASTGQQIFEQRACAACHGAAGAGGRSPAIAPLIAGRSDTQLLQVLHEPNARMKAGGMQPVAGSAGEFTSLVAYLRTLAPPSGGRPNPVVAKANPSAAPPSAAPASAPAGPPPSPVVSVAAAPVQPNAGHAVFVSEGCAACHGTSGGGTQFAPTLVGVSTKFPGDALATLLHHPDAKMKTRGMPPVTANPAEMKQLLSYLGTLDGRPAAMAAPATLTAGATQSKPATAGPGAAVQTKQMAATAPLSALAVQGQHVFVHYSCETCHGAGGLRGTAAAPGLAGTASILSAAALENLMRHHSLQMQNGNMPATTMNARDMKALISFVRAMPSTGVAP